MDRRAGRVHGERRRGGSERARRWWGCGRVKIQVANPGVTCSLASYG